MTLALAAATALLVLFNTTGYDHRLGYDALSHEQYVVTLAEGRLPDPDDTREFFCPPLPYVVAAALVAAGVTAGSAIKLMQWTNVLTSLALGLVVLLLAEHLRPGNRSVKRLSLLLLAFLPVYHRSFTLARAEPPLAFLAALAVLLGLRLFLPAEANTPSRPAAVALGVVFGLILLTRQQGVFVIAAVMLLALLRAMAAPEMRRRHVLALGLALAIGGLVGGWFYFSLWARFGSPMAFNKVRAPLSLGNRPPDFYLGTGDGQLFADPVRPSFLGQFFPTMYADTWGDYYGYFLLYAWDARRSRYIPPWEWDDVLEQKRGRPWLVTNRFKEAPYLGRVNLASLLPSALAVVGLGLGLAQMRALMAPTPTRSQALRPLLAVAAFFSVAGYFAVLLTLPYPRGTTIKAIYMLQVFPLLALLGADAATRLQRRSPGLFGLLVVGLLLVAIHDAPALVNAYWNAPAAAAQRGEP